jgi:hypothetical protein
MFRSATLIALAACAGLAAADDSPGVTSVRLSLGSLPTDADFTFEPGGSGSGSWDSARRIAIGAWRNFDRSASVSFSLGAGLALSAFDQYTPDGQSKIDVNLSEGGIFIEPGLAFNLTPTFAIEAAIPLGMGNATYEQNVAGGGSFDGNYAEIGLLVRPVLTLERVQLFFELASIANSATVEDNAGTKLTFDAKGALVSLGLGVTF